MFPDLHKPLPCNGFSHCSIITSAFLTQSPLFSPIKMLKVSFPCSDLFRKAGSGEKRREKFKNQMTVEIQFG